MRVFLLGATGRVGSNVLGQATAAGHAVTCLVRDPKRLQTVPREVSVVVGDVHRPETLARNLAAGFDAVVVAVGADPLKPSTVVADTARAVVAAMKEAGIERYIGITGTAEMPATPLGRLSTAILRLTPVRHAVRDHDAALRVVRTSGLKWTLVGCPYIKDGPSRAFRLAPRFPGGFKTIHPPDVARVLVAELASKAHVNAIIGVWY